MPKVKSEYEVEELYIDRLSELGYEYVELKNYDDVCSNFREQFCKLNSKELTAAKGVAELSDAEFDRIMLRLENHTIYESAKILREQWVLELDNGKTIYVVFFTNDETRNLYQVTHQVTMDPEHKDDVLYKNRYDVTILINGLPLVQTELKRPGIEINEAVNQINRYRRFSFRGLFRFIQLFVISNSTMTKFCANINENDQFGHKQDILRSLTFFWTDENNVRVNKLMDFTNAFLPKFHLTEMLSKYFVIKDTEPVLLVMRPYQVFAVKRAFDRIIMANTNGYVFHTTGSGKTLTSYKLASLLRDDRRIDFETHVDWHVHQHLLKVYFPTTVHSDEATFEIQFGSVKRKVHQNTSWDVARFESCGQKWMDFSEGHYGVSLLNDCKYGHSVKDGVIALTLIKSGIEPNPECDQGEHVFTYSLYPHEGSEKTATIRAAGALNQPALVREGSGTLGHFSLAGTASANVVLETIKRAENGDGWIVRLYETDNARTHSELVWNRPVKNVEFVNGLEETLEEAPFETRGNMAVIPLTMKPFEIRTLRIREC